MTAIHGNKATITVESKMLDSYKRMAKKANLIITEIKKEMKFENLSWDGISRAEHKIVRKFAQLVETGNYIIIVKPC